MNLPDLLAQKRDGRELGADQIRSLIAAMSAGEADDSQLGAWLMASRIHGLSQGETIALAEALWHSGRSVDLSSLSGATVDKHSTGGVADTTTLVVVPLLMAAGYPTLKLSGRGLGHTGGTLDKLAAVPGLRTDLPLSILQAQVERVGGAIGAASGDLAPADKQLYALRDVTATVDEPGLIAASVMSKKLAGGADHILLDVKVGEGALVPTLEEARELALRCAAIGEAQGRRVGSLLTAMDQPLGPAIGNALEVAAAVAALQGVASPLATLSVELAVASKVLSGRAEPEAREETHRDLASGAAMEKFRELIQAQGGNSFLIDRPWEYLDVAPVIREVCPGPGTVERLPARELGLLAGRLGAARQRQGDVIDAAVGLEILRREGSPLEAGEPLVRIHARSTDDAAWAEQQVAAVVSVGAGPVGGGGEQPLVRERLGPVGIGDEG